VVIIPNAAELVLLDRLLDKVTTWYHLYVTATVLGAGTVIGDFTEADWTDYAPKKVTTWSPAVTLSGRAVSNADQTMWIRGSGGPTRFVFGYYVTDGEDGPLLWCEERVAGSIRMQFSTDTVTVVPRITLREDPVPE